MKGIRILLVEDEADISEPIAELLAILGHEVHGTSVTKLEAINAAGLHTPDLMIVDVYLRIGNGVSAIGTIHQRTDMPHIFMSVGRPSAYYPERLDFASQAVRAADLTKAPKSVIWLTASATLGSAHLKP